MAKIKNFNIPIDEFAANEFDDWREKLPGTKGDKLVGALKAIQAIHRIDSGLAYSLMNPQIKIEDAVNRIRKVIADQEYNRALDALDPEARARILADAKQSKEKLGRKNS